MLTIRPERSSDIPAIHRVNVLAFERQEEANLVDALRKSSADMISLVALESDEIIGHILFTPISLRDAADQAPDPHPPIAGLGPLAVLPGYQRRGAGSRLVEAGLQACRQAGYQAVIVLGHPGYYPRFGFQPASHFNIAFPEQGVPPEAFMALELTPSALTGPPRTAHYLPGFTGV